MTHLSKCKSVFENNVQVEITELLQGQANWRLSGGPAGAGGRRAVGVTVAGGASASHLLPPHGGSAARIQDANNQCVGPSGELRAKNKKVKNYDLERISFRVTIAFGFCIRLHDDGPWNNLRSKVTQVPSQPKTKRQL